MERDVALPLPHTPPPFQPTDATTPPLPDADKATVRDNLFEASVLAPGPVRAQLAECVKQVAAADFPLAWPSLIPSLEAALSSGEPSRTHSGLLATRSLTRKFEFRSRDDGGAADIVVAPLFPRARTVAAAALAPGVTDPAAADAAKLAFKCLWSATFVGVPGPLVAGGEFSAWLDTLHAAITAPLPPGCPPDPDDALEWPWWKLKKWALHLVNRLAGRIGDPSLARPGTPDAVAATQWAAARAGDRFLEAALTLLSASATGAAPVSRRCVNLALQHCTGSLPLATPWKSLKPHVPALIASVCLPTACFDDEDAELWADDPAEYVRRGGDILAELTCPKHAAVSFVVDAARTRGSVALPPTMAVVGGVLAELAAGLAAAAAGGTPLPTPLARHADGALLLVGALSSTITRKPAYRPSVEPLVTSVVLPLLTPGGAAAAAAPGHLRAKAAWVLSQFAEFPFGGVTGAGPVFDTALTSVTAALHDPDLPVRVEAASALRALVCAMAEEGVPSFQASFPSLLTTLLHLMADIESEDVVAALEAAIEKVGPGVVPYAAQLSAQLVSAFDRLSASRAPTSSSTPSGLVAGDASLTSGWDEDDDDAAGVAACAVLRALVTVVDAVSSAPGALAAVEPIAAPLAARLLAAGDDGHDTIDEALDLCSYLTYFGGEGGEGVPPTVSPLAWALYDPLLNALTGWAADYFADGLPALVNYVTRGTAEFLAPSPSPGVPSRLERALSLTVSSLASPDAGDDEVLPAPRLLAVILASCGGRADAAVDATVGAVLGRLAAGVPAHDELRDALVSALGAAFYYSPALAAASVASRGAADAVFTHWLALASARHPRTGAPRHFRAAADKKLCLLGLAAAAAVPPNGGLPPQLDADRTPLLAAALPLLAAWRAQKAAQAAAADASSSDGEGGSGWAVDSGSDDDDGHATGDVGPSDDDDDGDAAAYVKRLAAAAARRAAADENNNDDDDDDDASLWSDGDSDADIETPFDAVDPGAVLVAAAEGARAAGRLAGGWVLAEGLAAAAAAVPAAGT